MLFSDTVSWIGIVLFCAAAFSCSSSEFESIEIPTDYQGGLFYAQPVATTGDTLRFLTDTGGALYLYADVAERLAKNDSILDPNIFTAPFIDFKKGRSIPPPDRYRKTFPLQHREVNSATNERDGLLGHVWFRDRIWTFDYENEQLIYHKSSQLFFPARKYIVSLFNRDEWGERIHEFPALNVTIEQDTLRFLFDTGATLLLTDNAFTELNDGLPQRRGTSFLVDSAFDLLRERHPEWRVIERADSIAGKYLYGEYEPIMEVPEIVIAGQKVGPVWFTRRNEQRFRNIVVPVVGENVQGALGASGLHYFSIYVDYQKGVAVFERVQ